ncbi:MAG: LUD domain-containing protein [Candidatus Aminicenantales bacterium]
MSWRRRQKKKIRGTLSDETLQRALETASAQHDKKFRSVTRNIPWEEWKERARAVKRECIPKLPELIQRFAQEAEKTGARVHFADTPEEARSKVEEILRKREAKRIVKAKSMVSEEIGLNAFLEEKGYHVVETDLGEWIVQLAGERPSHITAPALHKTKEDIARLLEERFRTPIPPDPAEIVRFARKELRKAFIEADAGITGANLAIAESGTLAIVSNEGNARLVSSLPPVHIALVTAEKFVETMEQAVPVLKTLITASSGLKMTAYVSFITGKSRTTDIEKDLVMGVHGPEELHIIILDNGRIAASKDKDMASILDCVKCGGCMLVCPVYQALGGHVYGGPVYPGGIGLLLTAMTCSLPESQQGWDFCSDCKKCESFCPMGIPTGSLLLRLKARHRASLWESAFSAFFGHRSLRDSLARLLALLQKPWQKGDILLGFPVRRLQRNALPAFQPSKPRMAPSQSGKKVYVFEGCMSRLFFPSVLEAAFASVSSLGYRPTSPKNQVCCGAPSLHLGHPGQVRALAEANIKSFTRENPDIILTLCPTGTRMLKQEYPRIIPEASVWAERVFGFSEFMVQEGTFPPVPSPESLPDVFYHYPCHAVDDRGAPETPLRLLQALGFSPVTEEEPLTCCGFCGVFSVKQPELSAHLWKKKRDKIQATRVTTIATDCPGCLFQMKSFLEKDQRGFRIFHTAELAARTLCDRTQSKKAEVRG